VRARVLDSARRTIELSDGNTLAFDKLLIATGSSPATPPIPGINGPGVHSCWTLADARAIANLARPGAKVLQMGAGFIGCIIMEALQQRGVELSVVEMGDRMVPRMMGPTAGGMIKAWCERKGVKVYTGARVEAIERGTGAEPGLLGKIAEVVGLGASTMPTGPMQVRLSTGDKLEADLVISATGVKPNIGFLENSGVRCLLGVLTDETLQTNVPGIYAAGDCAEAFDKVSGKTIVSAIQPNAAEQARVAALNMVGRPAELKGVTQINVLDTLGLISASFGYWEGLPGGEHVELTDQTQGRHLSLQFKNDVMVGCNSVGWTEHVGVMRGLVEGQVKLGAWKDTLKADPTRLMDAYLACAQGQGSWSGAADDRRR
jgi:NAD(P)H-nitrite reductase large subunit